MKRQRTCRITFSSGHLWGWCVRILAFCGGDYYDIWLGLILRVASAWIPMLGADSKDSEGYVTQSLCCLSRHCTMGSWTASVRSSRVGYL
jgi:hypothetical protein